MADVTITIDGNTTQLVTSAKKAQDALKQMGDGAARAGHASAGAFEKSAEHMGKMLIGAHAIVRALEAGRDKAIELQEALVSAKAQQGSVALRGGRAAAASGFNQKAVSGFLEQISPASQEERVGLVESLASANLQLSPQRLGQLLQASASGAFSSAEVLEAAKNGDNLNVQARMQALGPAALKELETRRGIDEANARTRGSDFNDQGARIGAEAQRASDLAHPLLAASRAALGTGDFAFGAGGALAKRSAEQAALDRIAENTAKLPDKKLNVSATTDNQ